MVGPGRVVLCTIGDAATRQGEFFEAVAQAVQERLPIVFVIEDNGYGISTPTRRHYPSGLGCSRTQSIGALTAVRTTRSLPLAATRRKPRGAATGHLCSGSSSTASHRIRTRTTTGCIARLATSLLCKSATP